jgi:NADH-quinone oxidoreductase subunit L
MTAFYMARLLIVVFCGSEKPDNHPHEAPMSMQIPLVVLGILAVIGGYIPYANHFGEWVRFGSASHEGLNFSVAATSTILSILAICLAWFIYGSGKIPADKLSRRFSALYKLSFHKYYIDELYLWVNHTFVDGIGKLLYWLELNFIEGIIKEVANLPIQLGNAVRKSQTGNLQRYGLVMFGAMLIVVVWLVLLNPLFKGALSGGAY